jgi:hypothetical protein
MHPLTTHDPTTKFEPASPKRHYLEPIVLIAHASGYTQQEIQETIEVSSEKLDAVAQKLLTDYQTFDLFHTVSVALNQGHIHRSDLVKDEVRNMALLYSQKINAYIRKKEINKSRERKIDFFLNQYLLDIRSAFKLHSGLPDGVTILPEELRYCAQHLKSYRNSIDWTQINQALQEKKQVKETLLQKLKCLHVLPALRRIFELGLAKPNQFHSRDLSFEKDTRYHTKNRILWIATLKKSSETYTQSLIQYTLVDYYNQLEDHLLFHTTRHHFKSHNPRWLNNIKVPPCYKPRL